MGNKMAHKDTRRPNQGVSSLSKRIVKLNDDPLLRN
jgi:hypothetical protein